MSTLHFILCQSSNETEFINGPLFQEPRRLFRGGQTVAHAYNMPQKRSLSTMEQIRLVWGGVKESKPGDCILLWGGGSIALILLTASIFRGRRVMMQNLIFNPERSSESLKRRLLRRLYSWAFRSKHYWANVNGMGLDRMYASLFGCDTDRFPLVLDPMHISAELEQMSRQEKNEPYVFCGGKAERDVACFARIVRRMPDVKFVCCFAPQMVTDELRSLPNLTIHTNVPAQEFYTLLCHSSYCCIPLKSMAPCGLLVMQRAALMGIPIVSTETYSMRTVVPSDDYGFLCPRGDDEMMAGRLRLLMDTPALREHVADNARQNMRRFTPLEVGRQMAEAINGMI